jgi:hypothetical protein
MAVLPKHHALCSFVVSIIFVALTGGFSKWPIAIFLGLTSGVLVDIDHLVWVLVLEPQLLVQAIGSLKISALYKQFVDPCGILYQRLVSLNRRHANIVFAIHGFWIIVASMLSPVILSFTDLTEYVYLVWLVLFVHFISDVAYWHPKV